MYGTVLANVCKYKWFHKKTCFTNNYCNKFGKEIVMFIVLLLTLQADPFGFVMELKFKKSLFWNNHFLTNLNYSRTSLIRKPLYLQFVLNP